MPFTFSIVLSTQNRGAICTMPPIETTRRMPISRTSEFFSKTSCFIGAAPYSAAATRKAGAAAMRGWSATSTGSSPRTVRQML